jgi:hypothetical protein
MVSELNAVEQRHDRSRVVIEQGSLRKRIAIRRWQRGSD